MVGQQHVPRAAPPRKNTEAGATRCEGSDCSPVTSKDATHLDLYLGEPSLLKLEPGELPRREVEEPGAGDYRGEESSIHDRQCLALFGVAKRWW